MQLGSQTSEDEGGNRRTGKFGVFVLGSQAGPTDGQGGEWGGGATGHSTTCVTFSSHLLVLNEPRADEATEYSEYDRTSRMPN